MCLWRPVALVKRAQVQRQTCVFAVPLKMLCSGRAAFVEAPSWGLELLHGVYMGLTFVVHLKSLEVCGRELHRVPEVLGSLCGLSLRRAPMPLDAMWTCAPSCA